MHLSFVTTASPKPPEQGVDSLANVLRFYFYIVSIMQRKCMCLKDIHVAYVYLWFSYNFGLIGPGIRRFPHQ